MSQQTSSSTFTHALNQAHAHTHDTTADSQQEPADEMDAHSKQEPAAAMNVKPRQEPAQPKSANHPHQSIYTRDVILVMAASFFFMFSTMLVTPLINGYALTLGVSAVIAGIITGSMSVVSLFLRPIAGNITDRFSKYRLSCIAGVLIFIGVVGYCIAPNGVWLIIFRLINGTGFVLATVCMTTWLGLLVPRNHVGEAMGFYGLMNALAMAIAPAVGIHFYKIIGYREALLLAAGAAFIMLIVIQFVSNHAYPFVQQKSCAGSTNACSTSSKAPWRNVKILQKDAFPITLFMICFSIPYFATQADLVEYVADASLHVSSGLFFIIYAVALLIIRVVFKKYFDLVRFGIWFWISTVAMAGYLLMMSFMSNDILMSIAAILLSIGYGVIYSVNQSTAMMLAPRSEQGLASSTFYIGLDIGMATAPMIGGVLATCVPHALFFPAMLVLLPLACMVYGYYRTSLNNAINHD